MSVTLQRKPDNHLAVIAMLAVMALLCTIWCSSCNDDIYFHHEIVWSPDGTDSIMSIEYAKNDGTINSYCMECTTFRDLYLKGGYSTVHNYYVKHLDEFQDSSCYSLYSAEYNPNYTLSKVDSYYQQKPYNKTE